MSSDERRVATPEDVPAGGAGADTGAVDAARVDPADRAQIPDISSQNDAPGVGTRRGAGSAASTAPDDEQARPAAKSSKEFADGGSRESEPEIADTDGRTSRGTIEDLEPGVDPESARTSRVIRSADLPDL